MCMLFIYLFVYVVYLFVCIYKLLSSIEYNSIESRFSCNCVVSALTLFYILLFLILCCPGLLHPRSCRAPSVLHECNTYGEHSALVSLFIMLYLAVTLVVDWRGVVHSTLNIVALVCISGMSVLNVYVCVHACMSMHACKIFM